ncbi:hypothetical protein CS063_02360 [Sporanaerobium hydrogeniformans]|uniref:Uncharacterized protein n=1 Tax=Sporanaerobium hydrogeniformans TaxID=3072179 RepID=A0AC61DHR7_9FIRM|nr:type IV pilus assembly protein PilM [Sporanaerobium hydrogeniformans]PHV72340.1 hypothetical protein CS063_02360 [Sporanaerobium hydrogeniformans]
MAKRIMGIELGNHTIKLLEVTKKAATLKVEKFALLEIPKEAMENGIITDREAICQMIREEKALQRFKAKKVVVVIQNNGTIIRHVVMDKKPEKLVRELLAIKPEEYLPIEQGHYQIDFKVVREWEEEGQTKMEVLLVAAPNSVILPMMDMIENLKLEPISMTIPSEALAKVFGMSNRMVHDTEEDVLILDIGGKSTTATIIASGQAVLTRMIEFGMEVINETINSSFIRLDASTMDQESKKEYDLYIEELIKPQIEYSIIAELERILQFYYSRFENRPIKKVYLIGGGTRIKGLRRYIKETLNIPTQVVKEFSTVIESPDIDFASSRVFFVNLLGALNSL